MFDMDFYKLYDTDDEISLIEVWNISSPESERGWYAAAYGDDGYQIGDSTGNYHKRDTLKQAIDLLESHPRAAILIFNANGNTQKPIYGEQCNKAQADQHITNRLEYLNTGVNLQK